MAADGYSALIVGAVVKGATSSLVKAYAEKVISPFTKIVVHTRSQAIIKQNLIRYVKSVEARTRNISSIAIPGGVFPLEDVYEPLQIKCEVDETAFSIESYPTQVFEHCRCFAINDDAGMGKSTLAKYIVRASLNESKAVPLLIELRRIRAGDSILGLLCKELAGDLPDSTAGAELINLFGSGNFLFVFDGFDELGDEVREAVTAEINRLASEFKFCYFILTSRKDYGTSLFPEFLHFDICDLTEEQAHSLLRRYDQGRGNARALINKLEDVDVDEFLVNPLLVTLLYKAFDYRQSVPPRRITFFRQVYDALFMDHDLSKGDSYERKKQSGLDIDEFHKLVRALGFNTLKTGKVSYSTEDFCKHLEVAVSRSSIKVDWQKVKIDLLRAVPLFVKDGVEFRWAHKSFQEYFAAQYIVSDVGSMREEVIVRMFESKDQFRFGEVVRFIAEADTEFVRDTLIEPLLARYFDLGVSDHDYMVRLFFGAADIYYIGKLPDRSDIQGKLKLLEYAGGLFGIDGTKSTKAFVDHVNSFAVLVVLKPDGVKLVQLPYLDRRNFPMMRRFALGKFYKEFQTHYGDSAVHVTASVGSLDTLVSKWNNPVEFSAAFSVPLVTCAKYAEIAADKAGRLASLEEAVLEGL